MASKKKPLPRSLKLKSLAGGAPTCGNPLRFTMQQQQQTQWCWAAVSVSVNLFYHPASGQTQCAVANVAMGQTTCCQNGSTAQCNQPWFLDQALQIVGNLDAVEPRQGGVREGQESRSTVAGRCACASAGMAEAAILSRSTAIRAAELRINIADPWYGKLGRCRTRRFLRVYQGGGTWTDNYTTQEPSEEESCRSSRVAHPEAAAAVLAANVTDILRAKRVPHGMKTEMHPEEVSHSEPHPVYIATLDDLAKGKLLAAARQTGWRYLLVHDDEAVARGRAECRESRREGRKGRQRQRSRNSSA